MNVEQEIKKLKKEEMQSEGKTTIDYGDHSWILIVILVVFAVKYFSTGTGFNLGAIGGYWWLVFFLPLIIGLLTDDETEEIEKKPN